MRSLSLGYIGVKMAFNRVAILSQTHGDYLI
ncbi:hypothetical protein FOXYSP1_20774 [Fusarium oxysporum f. sp. phaseoli]